MLSNRYVNRAFLTLEKHLQENVVRDKALAKETTMRVGGSAALFAIANTFDQLHIVVVTAKEWGLPLFVIGKGSNLLVSDSGFPGVVVRLGNDFMRKRIDEYNLRAGAGISLPSLTQTALKYSLSGICFAVGIPGSLGGALAMNAGAHGSCIGDVVKEVVVYSKKCQFEIFSRNQINFTYRKGNFDKDDIIVEATLSLRPDDKEAIKGQMEEYFAKRKSNQPLQFPNAGSVFKNPKGFSAGKLIEDAGCKGMRIGDAEVSTKHANFIINLGHASAFEVYSLLKTVQKRVFETQGLVLEPEIEFLGEFDEAFMATGR